MALDDTPDDVRPWTDGITFPVLIDPEHLLTEVLAISNVPTVVWIDEDDRIVRPNGVAFGTDMFKDFTGVEAEPHKEEIRRWARDDEVLARLHFRIAARARRAGNEAVAKAHFDSAGRLAPHDWTIRRAALPLVGDDPFGQTFFDMYAEWDEAGKPYHGLPAV